MRCAVYCTAEEYNLVELLKHFSDKYSGTRYKNFVNIQYGRGEAVYFDFGSVVFWNLTREKELDLLSEIKPVERQPVDIIDYDAFEYMLLPESNESKMIGDEIMLIGKDKNELLAASYALGQSAKLGVFEHLINKQINLTRKIPMTLAKDGKIPLSRRQIRKQIGELFLELHSINLHHDIIDTPDFFWDDQEYEPLYLDIKKGLDVSRRVDILNRRINMLHELFQLLTSEMQHQHSSFLEWIIILLIGLEIVFLIAKELIAW